MPPTGAQAPLQAEESRHLKAKKKLPIPAAAHRSGERCHNKSHIALASRATLANNRPAAAGESQARTPARDPSLPGTAPPTEP